MKSSIEIGYEEGELCNRLLTDGSGSHSNCEGFIKIHPVENCSCHIYPPCYQCTTPRAYCEDCDWDEAFEEREMLRQQTKLRMQKFKPIIEVMY